MEQEKQKKKPKYGWKEAVILILCAVLFYAFFATFILPEIKLRKAERFFKDQDYEAAYEYYKTAGKTDVFAEKVRKKVEAYIEAGDYQNAFSLTYSAWQSNWYTGSSDTEDPSVSLRVIRTLSLIEAGNYKGAEKWLADIDTKDREDILKLLKMASEKADLTQAKAYVESGNYEEAYRLLYGSENAECKELLPEIMPKYKEALAAKEDTPAGSVITFGFVDTDGERRPIEWLVLEKEDHRLLVIRRDITETMAFCSETDRKYRHEENSAVTWENSTVRRWLNETFYNEAFDPVEQQMIRVTRIPAEANPDHDTEPGIDTVDRVFLLSISEVRKYLYSNN
ncbi:MAG: hypothetical protein J6T47_03810, partial [Lachnospiraceae bacterium]|nr:hypothetical protein [Lachnospiraceae bacterium]